MKKSLLALSFMLAFAGIAHAEETLKVCRTSMGDFSRQPVQKFAVVFTVVKRADTAVVQTVFPADASVKVPEIKTEIGEFSVRAGISKLNDSSPKTELDSLNKAERAIFTAFFFLRTSTIPKELLAPGFDLELIRSAKLYKLGNEDGSTELFLGNLIEAKDAEGKVLGTFNVGLGSVLACEK